MMRQIRCYAGTGYQPARIFLFLFVFLLSAIALRADTHNAVNCSQAAVQAAINAASDGDTVQVPAGTAVWDTYVAISKPLSIIGSGNTTLTATQKMPDGFFRVQNLTTTDLLRISSFKIVMLPYYNTVGGTDIGIFIHYNCPLIQQLRIDHNTFVFGSAAIQIYDSKGVVDHNIDYNSHRFISYNGWNGTAAQAATWVDLTAGTDDPLFFEDNTQIIDANYPAGDTYGQFIDTSNGGKIVLRYNTMNADSGPDINKQVMMIHGNNTGGNSPDHSYWQQRYSGVSRGPSVVEWHNNYIHGVKIVEAIILRGATNLVYNNTLSSTNTTPKIHINDDEGSVGGTWSPRRLDWPAEDQVHNTFIWGNTFNGVAQTGTASDEQYINKGTGGFLVQLNRDYVYHPPQASGGREYFTGLNGASGAYPTDGIKYPTLGTMVFTSTGANAHYPYVPYVYPHPLSIQGESGRLLNLQAAPSGNTLALSWQPINGAVSYRIVRDWQEALAVIVTGTNWTDTAPTGEHVYMVYALDNAGKILAAEGKLRTSQSLNLVPGWNWISFNVLPADLSLNSVFNGILPQVEQLKSQTQSAIRISNTWKGDLTDMSGIGQYKMYKVKVNSACTLTVTGTAVLSANPIHLGGGWNWVAYLPTTTMPIATALDSIKGQVLEVKSLTQSATYNGTSWSGTLTQLSPGQGYAIKMSAPGTLIYPAAAAASPNIPE